MTLPAASFPRDLHEKAQAALLAKNFGAAESFLAQALEEDANDATALSLAADLFEARGEREQAIGHAILAAKAAPGAIAHRQKFIKLAGKQVFTQRNPEVEDLMLSCMASPDLDFANTTALWGSTLLLRPFGQVYARVNRKKSFFSGGGNPFDGIEDLGPLLDPYFLLGLKKIVWPLLPFENVITQLRAFLLESPGKSGFAEKDFTDIAVSVAHYCFHADYILDVTAKEQKRIEALQTEVEEKAEDPGKIALLACYVPLYALKNAADIEKRFAGSVLAGLIEEQIAEYADLQKRAKEVVVLTAIDDAVSEKVKGQYEEFPYPRWRELGEKQSEARERDIAALAKGGDVLVAGCGTGHESSCLAAAFPQAAVLAVDITNASLAYAARKADEYGLANIAYRQADILKLGGIGKTFDYISCAGVLHHMQDPEGGWKILERLLKPGGVMHIGLYGELPRRAIVEARALIAKGKYPATAAGMRKFRKDSPALLSPESLATLIKARDYYYLNMYRDLLFHVHEDRFDIPRVKRALDAMGLVFEGFKLPPDILARYVRMFPQDPLGLDLGGWQAFEQNFPDTFIHCYRFWCRKPA